MKNKSKVYVECARIDVRDISNADGRCSDKYEFIYFESGRGSLKIEGVTVPFEDKTVYMIRPLTYYEICADDGCDLDGYSVRFSLDVMEESLSGFVESLFLDGNALAILRTFSIDELCRVLSGIEFSDKLSGAAKEQYLIATAMQLVTILSFADVKRSHIGSEELAAKIAEFISESINENIFLTLDDIAKTFFVSKFYICRVFKSYSGTSIHAYINKKRMMLAKQYIDSGMSAKEASDAVGYKDYSAFYRAFVKATGKSPKSGKGE